MAENEFVSKTEKIASIIKPVKQSKYQVQVDWRHLGRYLVALGEDYGGLELNPDFQRGHVWTEAQQVSYIENVMRGVVPISALSIQLNCANWNTDTPTGDIENGIQCIDGLQRITAIQRYLAGEIKPFGFAVSDLDGSDFSIKLSKFYVNVQVFDYQNRSELLQHYVDFNSGGTQHPAEEIARVKQLINALTEDDQQMMAL